MVSYYQLIFPKKVHYKLFYSSSEQSLLLVSTSRDAGLDAGDAYWYTANKTPLTRGRGDELKWRPYRPHLVLCDSRGMPPHVEWLPGRWFATPSDVKGVVLITPAPQHNKLCSWLCSLVPTTNRPNL